MKGSFLAKLSENEGMPLSREEIFTSGCWVNSAKTCPIYTKSSLFVVSLKESEISLSEMMFMLILFFANSSFNFLASQSTTVIVSKKEECYEELLRRVKQ